VLLALLFSPSFAEDGHDDVVHQLEPDVPVKPVCESSGLDRALREPRPAELRKGDLLAYLHQSLLTVSVAMMSITTRIRMQTSMVITTPSARDLGRC